MPAIMADHDVEGQMQVLLRLLTSDEWHPLWAALAVRVESFASLEMPADTSDAALWRVCQQQDILLITGNRNKAGAEALEAVIARENTPTSLPVLTLSVPPQVFRSHVCPPRGDPFTGSVARSGAVSRDRSPVSALMRTPGGKSRAPAHLPATHELSYSLSVEQTAVLSTSTR